MIDRDGSPFSQQKRYGMLRTAIYVDAENIKMSGGFGMRYDVLVGLANSPDSVMLRANCYLAEDTERTYRDSEYRRNKKARYQLAGGRCELCGAQVGATWECDHVVPIRDGGSNLIENLRVHCVRCHREKTRADRRRRRHIEEGS